MINRRSIEAIVTGRHLGLAHHEDPMQLYGDIFPQVGQMSKL